MKVVMTITPMTHKKIRLRKLFENCRILVSFWMYQLNAGHNKVEVAVREGGVKLDKFFFNRGSTVPDESFQQVNNRAGTWNQ